MLTALIIEDEKASQDLLKQILQEYCPQVQLKGISSTKSDTINLIEECSPDVIFMDVNLEDCDAFEILENIDYSQFKIIFTTAHEKYALKAFKVEAVDYLLKPYSPNDVIAALSRINKQDYSKNLLNQLSELVSSQSNEKFTSKVSLSTLDGIYLVDADNVINIQGDGSYSKVFLVDGTSKIISKHLKEVERSFDGNIFFRTHTSHLVNLNKIKAFKKEEGGYLVMQDDRKVPVSRRKKTALLELIS